MNTTETIVNKIEKIYEIIKEIGNEEPAIANLLLEGFSITLNTIKVVAEAGGRETIDLSEQLEFVAKALGYNLEQLVMDVIQTMPMQQGGLTEQIQNMKAADAEVLDFITNDADLDDYEKFLAKSKAKDSLDFLKKEI